MMKAKRQTKNLMRWLEFSDHLSDVDHFYAHNFNQSSKTQKFSFVKLYFKCIFINIHAVFVLESQKLFFVLIRNFIFTIFENAVKCFGKEMCLGKFWRS